MRVLILGSGIIGTTSAYYLAKQGHQVRVIDRQPSSAQETSFANAGQISPGYASPWAAPGIPLKALKWILSKHSPLVVNPKLEWDKISFIGRMLANCNQRSYAINKGRMLRLAEYSRRSLEQLTQSTELGFNEESFDHRSKGTLQLFRTEKQFRAAQKDMDILDKHQVPYELLHVGGCTDVEPALDRIKHKLVGGLRLPLDQTGDCRQFTQRLTELCIKMGVDFQFNTNIQSINMKNGRIQSVLTDQGESQADQYVIAMGSYSTQLLKSLGLKSPVYPVKGYSITLLVTNEDAAPISTLMDETYKVAITRLGSRVRVAGTAELNGFNLSLNDKRRGTIRHVVSDLFPEGCDLNAEDEFWTGLRPMTPDGTPIIGATDIDNLFLNTGHGTLGWTMSLGSGRLLADIISGNQTDISHDDLSLKRYHRSFGLDGAADRLIPTT